MAEKTKNRPTSVEICAGAGGQAVGLEGAGFDHEALVELESPACATLQHNRPEWRVFERDVRLFSGDLFKGADLLAGGVPCPPFSKAGKQLGGDDDRDLFPEAMRLVDEIRPQAVMLENVRGLLDPVFADYRKAIELRVKRMGYFGQWKLLQASDFGVSQLRPRVVFVAVRKELSEYFAWPEVCPEPPLSVGELLKDLMGAAGWRGTEEWARKAGTIAQPWLVVQKNTEVPTSGLHVPSGHGRSLGSMAKGSGMNRPIRISKASQG